jgi:SAM-dependent methyltransferase
MSPELTERDRALLAWLREMDDQHVSTGLLARAFEAGWAACETAARLRQVTAAIEQAQRLESAANHDMSQRMLDPAAQNTPWMPFNLFDFAALLLESVTLIPDEGRFLDVGAGPGSKMLLARDVFGLDVHGIEILDPLAALARDAGLSVQTADADDWAGFEKFDCVWLNRPLRDREAERFLEERIYREMASGAVLICANLEAPPKGWWIINDSWDDLRRGAWAKPHPHGEEADRDGG